eukprot:TRINITY_DN940_c1_g1_i1.p1 TRINITY_DN940_c1_g1~~TRINITY_DN940_c1_g1_i1.p1  ORF type:complete len:433 (+),score=119.35 TRINITY_DN940_c1_g1_i1:41-1300(+)
MNHRDAMHNELRALAAQFRAHNQQALSHLDHNTTVYATSSSSTATVSIKEKLNQTLESSISASEDLLPLNHPYGQAPGIEDLIIEDEDSNLVESLTCQICLEIFDDPVCMACGHTFCRKCIKQEMKSRQRCPLDRRNLGGNAPMFRNTTVSHLIDGLPMRCSRGVIYNKKTHCWEQRKDGCQEILRVKNLESHLKYECEFVEEKCSQDGCAARLLRKDLLEHQTSCSASFDTDEDEDDSESSDELENGFSFDEPDFSDEEEEEPEEVVPTTRARSASKLWLFAKAKLGGGTSLRKTKTKQQQESTPEKKRKRVRKSKNIGKARGKGKGKEIASTDHQTKLRLRISTTSATNTTRTTSKMTITQSGSTVTTKTTTTTSSSSSSSSSPPPPPPPPVPSFLSHKKIKKPSEGIPIAPPPPNF